MSFLLVALSAISAGTPASAADTPAPVPASTPTPPSSTSGATCVLDTLSASLNELSPALNQVLQYVRGLDPKLVSLQRTPGWQDIEDLKSAIEKLKSTKTDLASRGRLEEAEKWATHAEAALRTDPKLSAMLSEIKGATYSQTYEPGEYALKRIYVKLLSQFDRELPRGVRIPFRHLPLDLRPPKLLAAARQLVSHQETRFASSFASSGFPDDAHLRAAINAAGGEYKILLNAMDNGQVEFAMNRPEGARWWTPKVGFENQRTTGSSRGDMDPHYRDQVEAKMTGTPYSKYKDLDNELKPEYGYLRPAPELGLQESVAASGYGSDTYIFKPDHVADRLTWTAGDSFGPAQFVGGDPENPVPQNWQGNFVPWKDRSLIVPEVAFNAKYGTGFEAGSSGIRTIVKAKAPSGAPVPPVMPAPPDFPTIVYPTPPASMPPRPAEPAAPALPSPPPFTGVGDYSTYTSSDPYKKYLADVAAFKATDAYKAAYAKWEADVAAVRATPAYKAWSDAETAYMSSPAYVAYTTASAAWSKAYSTYMASDAYKAYTLARATYDKAYAAYVSTDAYKAYAAAAAKATADAQAAFADRFKGTPLEPFTDKGAGGYIELQYFGPLTLDDVQTFEFKVTPPSGEFLSELRKRGIKIRDGRKNPSVDWDGKP